MIKSNKNKSIELNSVKETLILIARDKLNRNQKRSLTIIASLNLISNATQLAVRISKEAGFSLSTSWNIIRSLKNLKLLNFGDDKVSLTESGRIISAEATKNEF